MQRLLTGKWEITPGSARMTFVFKVRGYLGKVASGKENLPKGIFSPFLKIATLAFLTINIQS